MGGVYAGGNVRPSPVHAGLQSAQQQASPPLTSHLHSCLSGTPGLHGLSVHDESLQAEVWH